MSHPPPNEIPEHVFSEFWFSVETVKPQGSKCDKCRSGPSKEGIVIWLEHTGQRLPVSLLPPRPNRFHRSCDHEP